jgi:hypothetical protein
LIKLLGDASRDEAIQYAKEMRVSTPLLVTCVKPEGCSRRDMLISTNMGLLRLDEIGDVTGSKWQEIPRWQHKESNFQCSFHHFLPK